MYAVLQWGVGEGTPGARASAQAVQAPSATSGRTCGAITEKARALLNNLQATRFVVTLSCFCPHVRSCVDLTGYS